MVWITFVAFPILSFSQLATVTINPDGQQWIEKQTSASGGAAATVYHSGNSSADKTKWSYISGDGTYRHLRFRFDHPDFRNEDIKQLLLTVTYSDAVSGSGASIANVVVPDIGINNAIPWGPFLSTTQETNLFNAIQWGTSVFEDGIGTTSITDITETLLIYDEANTDFPGTTLPHFEQLATSFTIGLRAAVHSLDIESISATVTYDCGAVAVAPTSLTNSGTTSSSSFLSWSPVADADQYEIYKSGTLIATVPSNSYNITGLSANTTYNFKVRGINDCGPGPFSPTTVVNTCLPKPTSLSFSAITTTTANLNWSGSSGVPYNVFVNGSLVGTTTSTNYSLSGLTPGTSHNIRVIRTGAPCDSDPGISNVLTVPPTPSGLTATPSSSGTISLNWPAVTGASQYKIYNCLTMALVATTASTSRTISGLIPNTTYEYYIKASNSSGDSDASTCASATTLLPTPTASFTALSETEIQLDWSPVIGADEYEVYDCSNNLISTTTATTYNHTGLLQAAHYQYQVKATSVSNYSLKSSCDGTYTLPETPSGLTAEGSSAHSILLEWTSITGSAGTIQVFYDNGTYIGSTTGNSYSVTGLSPNTNYSFKIRQATPEAYSTYSSTVSAYTMLLAPVNVTSTPISTSEVELAWDAVPSADEYDIYDCTGSLVASTTSPGQLTITIGGLSEGVLYKYKVQGKNINTVSEFSPCVNSFTKLQAPTGVTVTPVSASSVSVSWTPVAAATGYNIYSCGGSYVGTTTSTSYPISGLMSNTNYSYKVKATYVSPLLPPGGSISGDANSDFSVCADDFTLLDKPFGLSTTTISLDEIGLSWTPVTGATYYVVEDCATGYITTTPATSTVIGGLSPGTTYEYKVKAYSATNQSEWSNCKDGMTGLETPVLTVTGSTSNTISLSWTPIIGATGYLVEYCSGGFAASTPAGTTTANVWGLSPLTGYQFKVKATFVGSGGGSIGGTNSSPYSDCASGSTTNFVELPPDRIRPRGAQGVPDVELKLNKQENTLEFYPNPFSNELNIKGTNIQSIQVVATSGEIVYSMQLQEPTNDISLNPDFVEGVYFVTVQQQDGTTTRHKVVKK